MSQNIQKQLRIIKNHCDLYYPCIDALNKVYEGKIELITDDDSETKELIKNFYLCPLCLENYIFIQHGIICCNEQFDNDHFPPKSIRGTRTILVCKKCNSIYGSDFDYSLKQHLFTQGFLKKKNSPLQSILSVNGIKGNYQSRLHWEKEKLVITVDLTKYPLLEKGIFDGINKGQHLQLHMTLSTLHKNKLEKALLKSAYLYCFSQFGYEFSLSYIGRNLIKVLKEELHHPLSNLGVFKDESNSYLSEGLYIIDRPVEFQCFMYICNAKLREIEENLNSFVLIPKFTSSSWEEFKNFERFVPKGELDLEFRKVNEPNSVIKEYFGYSKWSLSI